MRYLILASPRSGSTLLARMLHATGKAGDPREYFSPYLLAEERSRRGVNDLSFLDLLKLVEQESSKPDGAFGMHLHLSQFEDAFESSARKFRTMASFLRSFDKLIWVRRRRRAYQAASWAIAHQTRVFTSEQPSKAVNADAISSHDLVRALALVSGNDEGWKTILSQMKLPHYIVWYEKLSSDYEETSRGVLDYLELSTAAPTIPPAPIEKQSTEINDRLVRQLLSHIGVTQAQLY